MLAQILLRALVIAALWPLQLLAGEPQQAILHKAGGAHHHDPSITANASTSTAVAGKTMSYCDESISVCGKTASIKIVHAHKTTVYETFSRMFEDVTTLEPEFVTVTQVKLKTVTTETEGQCRQTTTIYDQAPLIITVDVNITSTREFVPIETRTVTETSTVSAKAIEQCIIKTQALLAEGPGATSSPQESGAEGGSDNNPTATNKNGGKK